MVDSIQTTASPPAHRCQLGLPKRARSSEASAYVAVWLCGYVAMWLTNIKMMRKEHFDRGNDFIYNLVDEAVSNPSRPLGGPTRPKLGRFLNNSNRKMREVSAVMKVRCGTAEKSPCTARLDKEHSGELFLFLLLDFQGH